MLNQSPCMINGPRPPYNVRPPNLGQPPVFMQGVRPPYPQNLQTRPCRPPQHPYVQQTNVRMPIAGGGQSEDIFGYNLNQRPPSTGLVRPNFIPHNQHIRGPRHSGPWSIPCPNGTMNNQNHRNGGQHYQNQGNPRIKWENQGHREGNQNRPMWKNRQNQNFQNNRPPQKRKRPQNKVDKRDLAENNKFFCDTCDRGYKDEDKYQEHVKQHVKCSHEGCPYIAHPKLVQLHVNLQHRSGLAKRIWQLESKEDIEKWRSERKRNFPTTENIAKKKEEIEQKIARGEIIETKTFGKMRNRSRRDGDDGGLKNDHGQNKRQQRKRDWLEKKRQRWLKKNGQHEDGQEAENKPGEHQNGSPAKKPRIDASEQQKTHPGSTDRSHDSPEDPLSVLLNIDGDSPVKERHQGTSITGALGSLMASYDDSEGEEEEDKVIKEMTAEEVRDNLEKDLSNAEAKEVESTKPCNNEEPSEGPRKRKRKRNRKRKQQEKQQTESKVQPQPKKSTLLEKLLAPEIRHERNVILQCVHYIVKNNFFNENNNSVSKEMDQVED